MKVLTLFIIQNTAETLTFSLLFSSLCSIPCTNTFVHIWLSLYWAL